MRLAAWSGVTLLTLHLVTGCIAGDFLIKDGPQSVIGIGSDEGKPKQTTAPSAPKSTGEGWRWPWQRGPNEPPPPPLEPGVQRAIDQFVQRSLKEMADVNEAVPPRLPEYYKPHSLDQMRSMVLGDHSMFTSSAPSPYRILPGTPYLPPLGIRGVELVNKSLSELQGVLGVGETVPSLAGQAAARVDWLAAVWPRGRWDFKRVYINQQRALGAEVDPIARLSLENFGNFNFEATAAALGLSQSDTDFGAGAVSQLQLKGRPFGGLRGPWSGDDPVDWTYRALGRTYFSSGQHMHDYFAVLAIRAEPNLFMRRTMATDFLKDRLSAYQYLDAHSQALRTKVKEILSLKEVSDFERRMLQEKSYDKYAPSVGQDGNEVQ